MLMKDKKVLVVGVANKSSIAWAITEALIREGAQVALTYQSERLRERVQQLAESVEPKLPIFEMDVTRPETVSAAILEIEKKWNGLDGLVHSIAFAPREDLTPGILKTPIENWNLALQVSSFSLIELMRATRPLFQKNGGGSVITLTYDTAHVYPNYNLMGVAKAALEAAMRYASWDAGTDNIRVNAVSAGPIKTLAARGISGFTKMLDESARKSPLRRNVTVEEVANASLFLLSPLASGITSQIMYVDAGQAFVGAPEAEQNS
jgi:enoyl-[acyl-carrier protein] reductase I